jgi:hypothetical protein
MAGLGILGDIPPEMVMRVWVWTAALAAWVLAVDIWVSLSLGLWGGGLGAGSTNCSGKSYAGTCTPHKAILDERTQEQRERFFGNFENQSEWEPIGTFMDFRFATNSAADGAMINKRVVGCLRAVEAELKARGSKYKVWSFMCSRIGEKQPTYFHGYAAACDINPSNGGKGNGCGFCPGWGSNNHDMPMDWVEIFEKYGWEWGGRWKNGTNGLSFSILARSLYG